MDEERRTQPAPEHSNAEQTVQPVWISPRERRVTASVAGLVFALFAVATLWFHDAAGIAGRDLGLSVWTEAAPTEGRLTPVVDAAVHTNAVAAHVAKGVDTAQLEAAEPGGTPKVWAAANAMAEALSDDAARKRLVAAWALAMLDPERLKTARALLRQAFEDRGAVVTGTTEKLAALYIQGLEVAAHRWVADELPVDAVVGLLRDNDTVIRMPARVATPKQGKSGAKDVQPAVEPTAAFVARLHRSIEQFLTSPDIRERVRAAWERDLEVDSAQEPLVKAIDRDFAGRWMWAIAAAIFVTAAISAVLGGIWRTYVLAGPGNRVWPFVAYLIAVAVGIGAGFANPRPSPTFLSDPVTQFNAFYQIGIQPSAATLKGVTVAAVCALLVSSWASFLFRTKDDDHLEQQLLTLRWSFHAATFVLVAGVLHVYAFYQWPSAFMTQHPAEVIQSGARVFALALGAAFSTLLLLIYVPGATVLVAEARARRRDADEKRAARIDDMLEEHGFDASPSQQIIRFAQLFAPLLIAPLGAEIVGLLGS